MSIRSLMTVPTGGRDIQWLAHALQEAIQLEWSTIPPYLCAFWSIKTGAGIPPSTAETRRTIQSIVLQEMLHMGLACNMLAGIGGTPNMFSQNFAPRYPGPLPGHVHQGLVIGLAGVSRGQEGNKEQVYKFMQIELPENPLAVRRAGYHTIGEFYDALSYAFEQNQPTLARDRQLTYPLLSQLTVLENVPQVQAKIDLIKRQGEGTSSSPFVDGSAQQIVPAHQLAHYYRFGEIHAERRLRADSTVPTGWSFTGDLYPFPKATDVYLMAEVPPNGYPESDNFDRVYTDLLKLLHDAWAQGDGNKLDQAILKMDGDLTSAALTLLQAGYPAGWAQGIKGPDFRFLRR